MKIEEINKAIEALEQMLLDPKIHCARTDTEVNTTVTYKSNRDIIKAIKYFKSIIPKNVRSGLYPKNKKRIDVLDYPETPVEQPGIYN